jgi:hypothetical protein
MHSFDSRGVARVYQIDTAAGVWRFWRNAPGFSQRYTCTINAGGASMTCDGELSRDGATWEQDLRVACTRLSAPAHPVRAAGNT